jgi:copper chaperone CopZ
MIKKIFHIPDMHCASCVMRLEGIEDELDGIKRINASYHKQQMEVEFDEKVVNEEKIVEAVKRKGYTVG